MKSIRVVKVRRYYIDSMTICKIKDNGIRTYQQSMQVGWASTFYELIWREKMLMKKWLAILCCTVLLCACSTNGTNENEKVQ